MAEVKKLYKVSDHAQVSGVCQGLSEYLDMDVSIVRVLVVISIFMTSGISLVVYIVMASILPDKLEVMQEKDVHDDEEVYTDEYEYNDEDFKI